MTLPLKIAALQMVSTPDVDRNLATATRLMAQAADAGVRLVALPEYFCLLGRNDRDKLAIAETLDDGPIQAHLAAAARRLGLWVIGGTLPLRPTGPDADPNRQCVPVNSSVSRYTTPAGMAEVDSDSWIS